MDRRAFDEEDRVDPTNQAVEALTTLALLDGDAAAAYQVAAGAMADEEIRGVLEAFRGDHLRHVDDLNRVIGRLGGAPVAATGASALLARLAVLATGVGPDATLIAALAKEEITTSTYDIALALAVDADTRALLERHFADERRHLAWLEETVQALFDDEDDEVTPPSE